MEHEKYININIEIGNDPKNYDMAIVSIDDNGSLGELNQMVLQIYGYDVSDISSLSLSKGFELLHLKGLKPILFIVTVGLGNVGVSLRKNLINGIEANLNFLSNKKVWIPLMGTGSGGMHFVDSFDTILSVLKKIKKISFTISLPSNKTGTEFYNRFVKNDNQWKGNGGKENLSSTTKEESFVKGTLTHKKELSSKPLQGKGSSKKYGEESISKNDISIEAHEFIKTRNSNYFLAGHLWDENDQLPRFIKESIWENGHETNDIDAVNSVKEGDIVFIKSTFSKNKISYLRIKSFGVVLSNPKDGHNLKVSWHLRGYIDIENLGKYRRTFAKVTQKDISKIIESILKVEPKFEDKLRSLEKFGQKAIESEELIIENKTTKIPGLTSDSDTGEDYLNIAKDIRAFARVMAAKSFNPPLAIALLGKWGSGKSFFMRKLKEQIHQLSHSGPKNIYCEGIAHVHFNAWSYMDTNLWAGIITKIFEGLQNYIKDTNEGDDQVQKIEEALTEKLNITQNQLKDLESQQKRIAKNVELLEKSIKTATIALDEKIEKIRSTSLSEILKNIDDKFDIRNEIKMALISNKSFNGNLEKFETIIPSKYWVNPSALYNKSKSVYTFFRAFFGKGVWKNNILSTGIILLVVIILPCLIHFAKWNINLFDFSLTPKVWVFISLIGTFITRLIKTFHHLRPLVASFWKIKENYESEKENILFEFHQKEKALQLEIENSKIEIDSLITQIVEAEKQKSDIDYRLKNTLTTEALFKFIENRSFSNDYKKHMGIVSIIRKDFEILSNLLTGHNIELEENKDSQEFSEKFNFSLKRIILYVDDLDRCEEDRVIQVLEAVNLLMAYPLFIVVVGVDPRWVKNALKKKYALHFNGNKNDDSSIQRIEPTNYLEKIFQVPFQLKDADDTSIKHMLKTLAKSKPEPESGIKETNIHTKDENDEAYERTRKTEPQYNPEETKETKYSVVQNKALINNIESLKFSEVETQLLQEMSLVIGSNPRAVKRFVNIFRIVKAHEDWPTQLSTKEIKIILFMLALSMGKFKNLFPQFVDFIFNDIFLVIENNKLQDFLIDGSNGQTEEMKELYDKIDNDLIDMKKVDFAKHFNLIKRFTFNTL